MTSKRSLKLLIFCAALFIAFIGASAATKRKKPAAFQDEFAAAQDASHMQDEGRKAVHREFHNDDWQSGRQTVAEDGARKLHREPFALMNDDDIHKMVDLAYKKTLANLRHRDKAHDGVLKSNNVPELLMLVMNPDDTPLSAIEQTELNTWINTFTRKQGLAVATPKPVTLRLLHTWSSIHLFRSGVAQLRGIRAKQAAKEEAQERATVLNRANIGVEKPSEDGVSDVLASVGARVTNNNKQEL